MSDRKLLLSRLQDVLSSSPPRNWRWILRTLVLAGMVILLALSVGWWVYSHTTDQDLYLKAEGLSRAARYREAVALYERVFAHAPPADLAESALFDAATVCHYHLGDMDRAIDLYTRVMTAYPSGRRVAEACWRLGQIYESNKHDLNQAVRMWEESIKVRPNAGAVLSTEQYLEVMAKIAGGYFDLNEFDKALAVYQRMADDYPCTHNADQANLKIGMILQMQRLYRPSLKPLKTTVQNSHCADCRFMAQTALIEAYENLEEMDMALQVVETLAPPPGQEDYARKERQRLRSKQSRLSHRAGLPNWRR